MNKSNVHPMWFLPVGGEDLGELVLMPCPGTKSVSVAETFQSLKLSGVTHLITALSTEEMQAKDLPDFAPLAQDCGLKWHQLPIPDDAVPDALFAEQWANIADTIQLSLDNGESVALHCMGGSGRTGLLAAHILQARNWALADTVEKVQALRPKAFTHPDQVAYVKALFQG